MGLLNPSARAVFDVLEFLYIAAKVASKGEVPFVRRNVTNRAIATVAAYDATEPLFSRHLAAAFQNTNYLVNLSQ
jgi:hypothetical protein